MWMMNPVSYCIPYTKNNSKWILDLNVKPKAIKLLEENTGKNLYGLPWFFQRFLIYDTQSTTHKRIKLIDWATSKLIILVFQTVINIKKQATDRRKYLISTFLIKALYLKYIKTLKTPKTFFLMCKRFEQILFNREDIWMTNKHRERYSASLSIR